MKKRMQERDILPGKKTKQWLNDFFILNAGTLLTAVGSYFFKFPNNFSTGGVSGISVVMTHYFPGLSNGTIVSVINIALLVVGLLLLSKGLGFAPLRDRCLLGDAQNSGGNLADDPADDRPAVYGAAAGRLFAGVGFGAAI